MDWTNAKGENAIQVACARGRPEILEMLVLLTLTAVLNHPSMKMDVLQNCENSFSFLRDDNYSAVLSVFRRSENARTSGGHGSAHSS